MEMRLQDPASPDESGRTNTDATNCAPPVSASAAQRKVTQFVVREISTQLMGEPPIFKPGASSSWVVPVMLTSPLRGIVGKVGEIAVDSKTGELLVDPDIVRRMSDDARQLAERSPL